jgi:hypothetical protein
MRYTENETKRDINDILDVIRVGFIGILSAPFRLINEISAKLMFLEREVLEKLLLTIVVLDSGLIVWDCVMYIFTGKLSFVSGFMPLFAKLLVLAMTGGVSYYILKKFEFPYEIVGAAYETVVEQENEEVMAVEEVVVEAEEAAEIDPIPDLEEEDVVMDVVEELEEIRTIEPFQLDTVSLPEYDFTGPNLDNEPEILIDLEEHPLSALMSGEKEETNDSLFSDEAPEISVDFLTRVLSDNTVFSTRAPEDLIFDIGKDTARRIAEADK